jgi:WD40 repeat protein
MSHIFISYSRKDLDFAQKIVDALATNDLDTWIDWKSIPKGEDWEQEIYHGIEEAEAFLFLISSDSVISEMCNKEIAHALKNGKRILPIFIADVDNRGIYSVTEKFLHTEQKEEINRRNFIICREGRDDFKGCIAEIRETIHTDYEWLKYHTRLQVKALEWGNIQDNSRLLRGKELREAEEQLAEAGHQIDPQPTELQRQYVLNSQRHEVRQRRRIMFGLSFVLVTVAALAVFAWIQRSIAQANEAKAIRQEEIAKAGNVASLALLHLDDRLDLSYLLGVEAFEKFDTRQSRDSLLTVLQSNPHLRHFLWSQSTSISTIAYSPDGTILATAGCGRMTEDGRFCGEGQIELWDVPSGQQIGQPLNGHTKDVIALHFSPDGQTLISGSSDDTVLLWNIDAGRSTSLPLDLPFGPASTLAFSPDGELLALGHNNGIIILWDMANGHVIGEPIYADFLSRAILYLAFSPDGKLLASGNYDGSFSVWDVDSQQPVRNPYVTNTSPITSLTFSSDSKTLAVGGCEKVNIDFPHDCFQGKIILWDAVENQLVGQPLLVHNDFVKSLAFGSEDEILASGANDGTLLLWDVSNAQPLDASFKGHTDVVSGIAFSPDGDSFASSFGNNVIFWDITAEHFMGQSLPSDDVAQITNMAIDPVGKVLAVGGKYGDITLWDIAGAEPTYSYRTDFTDAVSSLAYNQDNTILASGGCGKLNILGNACIQGKITVWDVVTGQILDRSFEGLVDSVSSLTFSPDGTILVAGGEDGAVAFWNFDDGSLIGSIAEGHPESVKGLIFDQEAQVLFSVDSDGTILHWDFSSGQVVGQPIEVNENVSSVAFSPDGSMVAIGTFDDTIALWDTATQGSTGGSLGQPAIDGFYYIAQVEFSPDNKLLASADCAIKAEDAITCLQGKIILWDVASGQPIGMPLLGHADRISTLLFHPGGTILISGGYDGTIILWNLDPKSWIEHACDAARRNFTQVEWQQYFPSEEYRITCPQWPAGE